MNETARPPVRLLIMAEVDDVEALMAGTATDDVRNAFKASIARARRTEADSQRRE